MFASELTNHKRCSENQPLVIVSASQTGVLKKNLSAVIDGRPAGEKKVCSMRKGLSGHRNIEHMYWIFLYFTNPYFV